MLENDFGRLGFLSAPGTRSRTEKEVTRLHTGVFVIRSNLKFHLQQTHAISFWSVSGNTDAAAVGNSGHRFLWTYEVSFFWYMT